MKKWFNKWLKRNKKAFITFGVVSIVNIIFTILTMNMLIKVLPDLQQYQLTKNITSDLQTFSGLGMFTLFLMVIWVMTFIYLILKIIFVSKDNTKKMFFYDELNFLKDLPSNIKKGIDDK